MNALLFVCELATFCFAIVSFVGRIARRLFSSIPAMTAICSILSILCVSAMVMGLPIPSPTPLVLAALSLALLVRSVRESAGEDRPLVIEIPAPVAVPVAPVFAPLPEEIEDIAGSYPMVDRFAEPAPVAQDAVPAAPAKKPVRKPAKSRKVVAPAPVPLEEMPHDELIVLAKGAGVKGVSARWGTAALARKIREARAAVS